MDNDAMAGVAKLFTYVGVPASFVESSAEAVLVLDGLMASALGLRFSVRLIHLQTSDFIDYIGQRDSFDPILVPRVEALNYGARLPTVFMLEQTWQSNDTTVTLSLRYEMRPLPSSDELRLLFKLPVSDCDVVVRLPWGSIVQSAKLSRQIELPE